MSARERTEHLLAWYRRKAACPRHDDTLDARRQHTGQRVVTGPEQTLVSLAQRVVRGAVAFMAVTTVAATAVGFWLSYAGLHVFAYRAGLRGPEAWAWPASVDLFILAGELGITVSAIRGQRDWLAWCYLLAGFGPSVAFNVLHVATITPAWGRYAVAAVPPVAAMLALAALMRQVLRLAAEAHLAAGSGSPPGEHPAPVPGEHPVTAREHAPESAPALNGWAHPESIPTAPADRTCDRSRARAGSAPVPVDAPEPGALHPPALANGHAAPEHGRDAAEAFADDLATGQVPSIRKIRRVMHLGQPRAQEVHAYLTALART